jgi:hypothetical protein
MTDAAMNKSLAHGLDRSSNGVALFIILSLTQRLMEVGMNSDASFEQ